MISAYAKAARPSQLIEDSIHIPDASVSEDLKARARAIDA